MLRFLEILVLLCFVYLVPGPRALVSCGLSSVQGHPEKEGEEEEEGEEEVEGLTSPLDISGVCFCGPVSTPGNIPAPSESEALAHSGGPFWRVV